MLTKRKQASPSPIMRKNREALNIRLQYSSCSWKKKTTEANFFYVSQRASFLNKTGSTRLDETRFVSFNARRFGWKEGCC